MLIKSFEDYTKGQTLLKILSLNLAFKHFKLSESYKNQNKIAKSAGIKLLARWLKLRLKVVLNGHP